MTLFRLAAALGALIGSGVACEAADRTDTSSGTAADTAGTGAATATGTGASTGEDGGPTDADAAAVTDTGAPPVPDFPCTEESECFLHGDCCTCVALHRDQPVPEDCPADCERDACDVWGLSQVLCSHECRIELVECDPAMVTCTDAPPSCPEGEMPSLDERCYSGHCVPQELCRP